MSWGTGAVRVDDTVYVYGAAGGHAYVARVAFDAGDDRPMVVLDRDDVGTARGAAAPMTFARRHAGAGPRS